MIAKDVKQELFEILGFVEETIAFGRITEALRKLQQQRDDRSIELILIQSWGDRISANNKRAVLFMVRAQELYRTGFFDEAQKYEGLAIARFNEDSHLP